MRRKVPHHTDWTGFAAINGTENNDLLQGAQNQANTINGYGGDDNISGANLDDAIDGGAGNDTANGGLGADFIMGGAGTDHLSGGSGDDTIYGATYFSGSDTEDDYITGGSGDDVIQSWGGRDLLYGDAGDDYIEFYDGAIVVGGVGDDIFEARSNQLQLDTTIDGGAGDDTLYHQFQDTYSVYQYSGGAGEDTISYITYSAGGVVIDLTQGYASANQYDLVQLFRVEDAEGTDLADTLIGDGGTNALIGGDGDDIIAGRFGGDWLDGGAGIDTADYSASNSAVRLDFSGSIIAGGDAEGDHLLNFERFLGSRYDDTMVGSSFAVDYFMGGAGNDTLNGNKGNDTLIGDTGDDLINGGGFIDLMTGNEGADRFVYTYASDASVAGSAYDEITDFHHNEKDRIDLVAIDADPAVTGNQRFRFIGTAAFDGGHGEVRVDYSLAAHAVVLIDINGDKAADMGIWLDGITSANPLKAGDFLL